MTGSTQMTPESFREQLGKILLRAEQQGNRITRDEISAFFSDMDLTEEQLELVCEFLLSRKVIVSDSGGTPKGVPAGQAGQTAAEAGAGADGFFANAGDAALRPEERRWLEIYREELTVVPHASQGELQLHRLLPAILEHALQMERGQVLLQDLVQEGNLQLLLAKEAADLQLMTSPEMEEERMLQAALDAMQALAAEQAEMHTQDRKMVEKAENLKDGIAVLKEELGRKVYLDEVADFLSMTEEEAENILRLTGEEPAEE